MVAYNPSWDTVEEASKKSKSGNPLDLVVEYKNYMESKGEAIDSDVLVDWNPTVEDPNEVIPKIVTELYKYKLENESNLKENIILINENIEYKDKTLKTTNTKMLLVISILLLLFAVLFILKRKRIFLLFGCVLIVCGIIRIIVTEQVIDNHKNIENYILGMPNKYISKSVDVDKYLNEMKDILKLKYDISILINDYILKEFICVVATKNGETIREKELYNYDSSIYPSYEFIDDITDYPEKTYFEDIPLYKYNEYKANSYNSIEEMLSSEIQKEGIMYEDVVKICDHISYDKTIDFDNFINELNRCIKIKETNPNEIMFKYVNRIMSKVYVLYSHKYYDNSVISYFKDWYIDGKSRDIELPYGVTLEYRAPEFVKKDIKEIVYTNERELDHDSNEKQVYVMYYKDSDGKLGASYTDIEFTKTGSNYEISFNPVDLMYDIKKPTARLVVK